MNKWFERRTANTKSTAIILIVYVGLMSIVAIKLIKFLESFIETIIKT